ncbi:OTU domain-containing protein [Candidatus Margulisiibacteriota bacterium]
MIWFQKATKVQQFNNQNNKSEKKKEKKKDIKKKKIKKKKTKDIIGLPKNNLLFKDYEEKPNRKLIIGKIKIPSNNKLLNLKDYSKIDVPTDNSCLFWSVALGALLPLVKNEKEFENTFDLLFGKKAIKLKSKIRKKLIDFNPLTFENDELVELVTIELRKQTAKTIKDNEYYFKQKGIENVEKYINKIKKDDFWGGEIEINAISMLLKRKIKVLEKNSSIYKMHYGDEYPGKPIILAFEPVKQNSNVNNHYRFIINDEYVSNYKQNPPKQDKIYDSNYNHRRNPFLRKLEKGNAIPNQKISNHNSAYFKSFSGSTGKSTPGSEIFRSMASILKIGRKNYKPRYLKDRGDEIIINYTAQIKAGNKDIFIENSGKQNVFSDLDASVKVIDTSNPQDLNKNNHKIEILNKSIPKTVLETDYENLFKNIRNISKLIINKNSKKQKKKFNELLSVNNYLQSIKNIKKPAVREIPPIDMVNCMTVLYLFCNQNWEFARKILGKDYPQFFFDVRVISNILIQKSLYKSIQELQKNKIDLNVYSIRKEMTSQLHKILGPDTTLFSLFNASVYLTGEFEDSYSATSKKDSTKMLRQTLFSTAINYDKKEDFMLLCEQIGISKEISNEVWDEKEKYLNLFYSELPNIIFERDNSITNKFIREFGSHFRNKTNKIYETYNIKNLSKNVIEKDFPFSKNEKNINLFYDHIEKQFSKLDGLYKNLSEYENTYFKNTVHALKNLKPKDIPLLKEIVSKSKMKNSMLKEKIKNLTKDNYKKIEFNFKEVCQLSFHLNSNNKGGGISS